jgi:ribosomal protein S18 acetylase RimI-like enzyme
VIRRATASDRDSVRALYKEFFTELGPPPEFYGVSLDQELGEVDEILDAGFAFVADEHGELVGFFLAARKDGTRGLFSDIYVRPEWRRQGVATDLAQAATEALVETGATHVTLSVEPDNAAARAVYATWGFREQALTLAVPIDELTRHLAAAGQAGPSFGSVHVQTDDLGAVARATAQFIPRLPGHSEGTIVAPPRNGWIAVYDESCDHDHELLRRLARELSDRMGAVTLAIGVEQGKVVRYLLYERGRMVDEYLSVPELYGPLPPGDAVALGANPTVVARLTGADPREVRTIARVAPSPADLPPAPELLAQLAAAMKIEGAEHGYAEAGEIEGAVRV